MLKSPLSPPLVTNTLPDSADDFIADDGVEMLVLESESDSSTGEVLSNLALKRRIWPVRPTQSLYNSWSTLIPTLVKAQLQYSARTHGKPLEKIQKVISACRTLRCASKRTSLVCLFLDRKRWKIYQRNARIDGLLGFESIEALSCHCSSLPQVLIHHGLFPTALLQP